jgi:hypothetical protein
MPTWTATLARRLRKPDGQWVDRSEHVNLNELFERMTQQELETYARDGSLPTWFATTVGATASDGGDD